MKHLKYLLPGIFIVLLMSSGTIINKYTLDKDYTVTIHGTSNLHDWDENVGIVTGDAIIDWNADKSFDLNAVHIKMDVHSIKSHEGSGMNNNTYKALKADANPTIIFALNHPLKSIKTNSTENDVSMVGSLTIAGVIKPVTMKVKLVMDNQSILTIEGAYTIKMADYDVTPPTALFGTIKTGDSITLNFKGSFSISN
jgi:polyisoprenoid-binding protein YceI